MPDFIVNIAWIVLTLLLIAFMLALLAVIAMIAILFVGFVKDWIDDMGWRE